MCSGYYRYSAGYTPEFPGLEEFAGTVVHPRCGRTIWITATKGCRHWQRRHGSDPNSGHGGKSVPCHDGAAFADLYRLYARQGQTGQCAEWSVARNLGLCRTRWRKIRFQNYFYKQAIEKPAKTRAYILKRLRKALKPEIDVEKHFTPSYDPWTQRLCLVPDSDLFHVLNSGKASVITGTIARITSDGIEMQGGEKIEADVLVTATGIQLELLGGVEFFMDDQKLDFSQRFFYQGMMFSGVPNLIQTFGYINASWTLRADLNSEFVCALLKRMDETGTTQCVPLLRDFELEMGGQDWVSGFNPGYFKRGNHLFPKQGSHSPWHNTQDYLLDLQLLAEGPPDDGVLQFQKTGRAEAA